MRRILGGHMAFSGTERGSVVANKVQSGVDYGNLTAPEDVKNNQNFKRLSWVYCVFYLCLLCHFILASYYNKLVLLDISTVPPLGLGPLKRKKKENSATIQLS